MVRCGSSLLFLVCLAACAYRPVYGPGSPPRLHVKLLRTLVPDAVASDEVASGVREELARAGALADGDGWPQLQIEVLREDESSDGIASAARNPYARGIILGLVARAWILASPGAVPEHDTGDVRAADVVAVDARGPSGAERSETASTFHTADALRAAARRLGHKLGQSVQGFAVPNEEPFDR